MQPQVILHVQAHLTHIILNHTLKNIILLIHSIQNNSHTNHRNQIDKNTIHLEDSVNAKKPSRKPKQNTES